jgi:hypothetical protein
MGRKQQDVVLIGADNFSELPYLTTLPSNLPSPPLPSLQLLS